MGVAELVDAVERRVSDTPPHLVGIAGPVAVGKSTIAEALAAGLTTRGRRVAVVATDAFLLPNALLAERDALYRKGFPETYDWAALLTFLGAAKSAAPDLRTPVYSHLVYDIVPGEWAAVGPADLVVIEGVVALQPRLLEALDVTVYVDADEAAVRQWFGDRFVRLTQEARAGAKSFYRIFAPMTDEEVRAAAEATWDAINGPNLHEHIAATRQHAMVVVEKGADHSVTAIREIG